ncbi:hypothetical protein [Elioraea sp.]|uniref:2-amino-5-chloromuconate deaminase CnbZ n=1 Tax=Elioraea sp. TaxID=2185103 RepID=UPI0025C3C6B1|nr:hypothetical protein [Elioraea sp.]
MTQAIRFDAGGYRYIPSVFQYSAGIAALDGFEVERACLHRPLPMSQAFAFVERHLEALGRPPTAFAACELRSPAPFTDQGFTDFNRFYVATLERWGIWRDGANPVARTNVCPFYDAPSEPVMFAFSYTVPARGASARPSFVIAGGGEAAEGSGPYRDRTVRHGETHPEALRQKLVFVRDAMEARLAALGLTWADAVQAQLYTVFDIGHLFGDCFGARGVLRPGVVWHYARPPVVGLDVEMDVMGPARTIVI